MNTTTATEAATTAPDPLMDRISVAESGVTEIEAKPVAAAMQSEFSKEQVDLIKRTICKGSSDDELALFVATAKRMGLDPFARQIWGVMRPTKDGPVLSIQVSIDGFRLIAVRTGRYEGQVGPFYCGPDKKWTDTWISDKPPLLAKVGVVIFGAREPTFGYAKYSSYVQTFPDGNPFPIWKKFGDMMVGKCAEAIALRKMFPSELSGVYSPEEMAGQDFIANPVDPDVMTEEQKKENREIIEKVLGCRALEEIDHLEKQLKERKLTDAQRKAIWPTYKAHKATIIASKGGGDAG